MAKKHAERTKNLTLKLQKTIGGNHLVREFTPLNVTWPLTP